MTPSKRGNPNRFERHGWHGSAHQARAVFCVAKPRKIPLGTDGTPIFNFNIFFLTVGDKYKNIKK